MCGTNFLNQIVFLIPGCDDIIRQHKAACLRVTALLAHCDTLWVGTSAGVLLTAPLQNSPNARTGTFTMPQLTGKFKSQHGFLLYSYLFILLTFQIT